MNRRKKKSQAVPDLESYLGLPVHVGQNKCAVFSKITSRVKKHLGTWKAKFFSAGGREVLIKSVVQAIPTYLMSLFRLPVRTIKDLHAVTARFWWGGSEESRKIHWRRWDVLAKPKGEGGLGFKDMGDFNRALVARLSWRIIQNPGCLLARILKAKYYPDTSILDFNCKGRSSFLCKSLCWGRDLLRRGTRWQIGDGNVRVHGQPWIPRPGAFFATSEAPDDGYPWRVADLISHGHWDLSRVEALLTPYDAEAVLRIPVGKGLDRLVWHHEDNGIYSVRSGYRLARSEARCGPSGSGKGEPNWWKALWGTAIPAKVKHMVWRAWSEALPTNGALRIRGVDVLPFCNFCGALPEDALHAIWGCERAKAIWASSTIHRWVEKTGEIPFRELCYRALESLSKPHFELFCGLIWATWSDRNLRLFEHRVRAPEAWVEEVDGWFTSFKRCAHTTENHRSPREEVPRAWSRPVAGSLKLNVDAAWDRETGRAAVGAVVRDHLGRVMGVLASLVDHVDSALTGECIAMRRGLLFAREQGWRIEHVETDCLRASHLTKARDSLGLQGPIIAEVRELSRELGGTGEWTWVPRECNEVANALAKRRLFSLDSDLMCPFCPEWLVATVLRDFSPQLS